jgi:hypothetical protein
MKVKSLAKAGTRPQRGVGRATLTSSSELQRRYEHATAALQHYFPQIDSWLADHNPDLWREIRLEDDELRRLQQLGVSASRFQARLDALLACCERAERAYYEARPYELQLPLLPPGQRIAVYCEYANGSLLRVNEEE